MPCLVAIVDCINVHHVVHYTNISTYDNIVANVDFAHVGSVSASFKELETKGNSTKQTALVLMEDQLAVFGFGNSVPVSQA